MVVVSPQPGPVDLLVLGAQKAGTTTLWQILCRQSWFARARTKELHHFDRPDLVPDSEYRSWFRPTTDAMQLRGEATPGYLSAYRAPARIHAHNPEVKLVALLRDPVDRARSAFQHARRIGKVDRHARFEDIYRDEARRRVTERSWTRIRWDGMYARHLERYLEHFPPEQLHVLFFEDLVADPEQTLAGLWRFVGREGTEGPRLPHANPGRDTRLPFVERAAVRLLRPEGSARRLPTHRAAPAVRAVRRRLTRELTVTPLSDGALDHLVADYAPEVERVSLLLGRRPPWPRFAESGGWGLSDLQKAGAS